MKIEDFNYFKTDYENKAQELDLDIHLSEASEIQPSLNDDVIRTSIKCILTYSGIACVTRMPSMCISC